MFKALDNARKAVTLRMECATADNLRALVTLGCRTLHYTGHGLPTCLAFEDGEGRMHALEAEQMKFLFTAGGINGGSKGVRFVFVSACHSEAAGWAFVRAGCPHVIAVRTESQVPDACARTFTHHFYLALLVGKTVKSAFEIGKAAVQTLPHATPNGNDPNQFLLLPDGIYYTLLLCCSTISNRMMCI